MKNGSALYLKSDNHYSNAKKITAKELPITCLIFRETLPLLREKRYNHFQTVFCICAEINVTEIVPDKLFPLNQSQSIPYISFIFISRSKTKNILLNLTLTFFRIVPKYSNLVNKMYVDSSCLSILIILFFE